MNGTEDAVVAAMSTLAGDIMSTLASIAPVAIGIFGIFLAWRYGKKIFNIVAR